MHIYKYPLVCLGISVKIDINGKLEKNVKISLKKMSGLAFRIFGQDIQNM